MPPKKVQPIDSPTMRESMRTADSAKPVLKSRLRRLFDRQFAGVLRVSSAEKSIVAAGEIHVPKDFAAGPDFEPSSICLANLVQNFIEESNDRQSVGATAGKFGRNRCNCFNGNSNDSSDDEFDPWNESTPNSAFHGDSFDIIKSLVPCSSMVERNLLADTAKIVEQQSKIAKRKNELRKLVTDGLSALGYDASVCKSRWEKSPSYPAGEYEYIDVVMAGGVVERLLIDVDFRSEFDIARSTGAYKTILQSLPFIFVGKSDRLERIVFAVSEAATQSLKKKGMHIPPWRKAEYMRAKWLSLYTRAAASPPRPNDVVRGGEVQLRPEKVEETCSNVAETETKIEAGEPEMIFGERTSSETNSGETKAYSKIETETETDMEAGELEMIFGEETLSESNSGEVTLSPASCSSRKEEELISGLTVLVVQSPWQPPAILPRSSERGGSKVVTGLASLLKEKL